MQSLPAETASTPAASPTAPLLSNVLAVGCVVLALLLVAIAIYIPLTDMQMLIDGLKLKVPPTLESLSAFQRALLGGIFSVGAFCQAYGLFSARRCFQSFARREYFTLEVVKGLRGFAIGMFFWPVATILAKPLLSFVATLNNTLPDSREVSIGIGTEQVLTLLFAGILWQIAGVMTSAKRLADENSQFV